MKLQCRQCCVLVGRLLSKLETRRMGAPSQVRRAFNEGDLLVVGLVPITTPTTRWPWRRRPLKLEDRLYLECCETCINFETNLPNDYMETRLHHSLQRKREVGESISIREEKSCGTKLKRWYVPGLSSTFSSIGCTKSTEGIVPWHTSSTNSGETGMPTAFMCCSEYDWILLTWSCTSLVEAIASW